MDMFSRTFDRKYYDNAAKIQGDIGGALPHVNAWERMDASFSFPRVRRYDIDNSNMDMLEHFQDNLNTNVSNQVNVDNFIRVGKAVGSTFDARYKDGEWDNPASHDPRMEAWDEAN
jgi:pantothenate kinase